MLKLFRKYSRYKAKSSPGAEKAAGTLAKGLLIIQTKWANWMSTKEKQMTLKQKRRALTLFCLVLGLVAGSLLYNGLFVVNAKSPAWLKPPPATFPTDTRLPDSLNLEYLRELYEQKTFQQTDSIHK